MKNFDLAHSVEESITAGTTSWEESKKMEVSQQMWEMVINRLTELEKQVREIKGSQKT